MKRNHISFYVSGSSGNVGDERVGRWEVTLRHAKGEKTFKGYESRATHNQMYLRATIEGMKALKEPCEIKVLCPATYLQKAASNMKQFKANNYTYENGVPIANVLLWEELIRVAKQGKHHLVFEKM